jgi:hypothetical protein
MYEARSQLERIHAVGGGKAAIGPAIEDRIAVTDPAYSGTQ